MTGAAWALTVLRESSINQNIEIQQSFTSAFAEVKLREIRATIESCRRLVSLFQVHTHTNKQTNTHTHTHQHTDVHV